MKTPLDLKPYWFVPLRTISAPGAALSSMRSCLPGMKALKGISTVLVFETIDDAWDYREAYMQVHYRDTGIVLEDHGIHSLTPAELHDTFMIPAKSDRDVMYVPVGVLRLDAQEVIGKLKKEGPAAATAIATDKAMRRAQAMR